MTDWRSVARARCPDIPESELDPIAGALEALEASFAPLAASLPIDAETEEGE